MTSTDAVLGRLQDVRRCRSGWTAICPGHPDKTPSLSVCRKNGRTLLHCHAGCSVESIARALQMKLSDLFDEPLTKGQKNVPRRTKLRQIEISTALADTIKCARDAEALIVGEQLPILSRHRRRAWQIICARFHLEPVHIESPWWEISPHDCDPIWPLLAERALDQILWDSTQITASPDDLNKALDLAAQWLRQLARSEAHGGAHES